MRQLWCYILVMILGLGHLQAAETEQDSYLAFSYGNATFQSEFPLGIGVSLDVTPAQPLIQARLFVTLDSITVYASDSLIPVHQAGETITVSTRWNGITLSRDPSPPWMSLQYWWMLTDATGATTTTPPELQIYADTTHRNWVNTDGLRTRVYTYNQNASFINQVLGQAEDAVQRLELAYGFALPYRPAIIFYNSSAEGDQDLKGGLNTPFGGFIVGRAYPGTSGVVILARQDPAYLQRTIIHELAHLYQYQLGAGLFEAPHWWIEGDAKAQEPPAIINYALSYARGMAQKQGLPESLATWNSRNYNSEAGLDNTLLLGASFVTYLKQIYGAQSIASFYANWKVGGSFEGAFSQTFGANLDELDQGWRTWLLNNNSPPPLTESIILQNTIAPPILPDLPPGMARVNTYWLNFRDGPSTEDEALALLNIGQLLLPLGRNEAGDWLLVELPDGTQGWLFADYVDYEGDLETLTVSLYH